MNYIPFVIENTEKGERSFDIYSRLLQDRIIMLVGEINDSMSALIVSELLYLDSQSHNDINLYISSPGGSITSGLSIIDTIYYINSKVNTICFGYAMSMAAVILAAGTKKRYALSHAEVMIHQPQGGMQGQVTDIKIQAERLINTRKNMNELLANYTKMPIEKIEHDTERDLYMTPEMAIDYHIIDEIIEHIKEKAWAIRLYSIINVLLMRCR